MKEDKEEAPQNLELSELILRHNLKSNFAHELSYEKPSPFAS